MQLDLMQSKQGQDVRSGLSCSQCMPGIAARIKTVKVINKSTAKLDTFS
jgi:hypothetical protein